LVKSAREIMEILEAFDLTRCAWSAAELVGCDHKTVARYVTLRDAGADLTAPPRRPREIDPFLAKVEELVDRSQGKIRADVVHDRLAAMGYDGSPRSTRRAVAELKAAWKDGRSRRYRPWIPEPGMWLQFDWGDGPRIGQRATSLFCAWLAWSRYRVVIPTWDQTLGTLVACLDQTLRRIGGAPTYLLTDNAKTVTADLVAGVPIRHPEMVAVGRHYGCKVETCMPYDPESKGGVEATVRIAKADLVLTTANLLGAYDTFAELIDACERFCERVNAREHPESRAVPTVRLAAERAHLHVLPAEPHTLALGEDRLVKKDQTISWGGVRYSTPLGWRGQTVWCRAQGEELVIVGRGELGLEEVCRHRLSTPGSPRILDEHYPGHPTGRWVHAPKPRPRTPEEVAFLAIGEGAHRWLVEAAAAGASKIRRKMARATELAAALGADRVDQALGLAAIAGRFEEDDLPSILDHLAAAPATNVVVASEAHSAQPGTSSWRRLGQ
jgi:transposase